LGKTSCAMLGVRNSYAVYPNTDNRAQGPSASQYRSIN
jgi:hypothetical protein